MVPGVILLGVAWAFTKFNFNPAYTTGQKVDSLNGVYVYYNGGVNHTEGRNTADGYNLGIKYQCVEFVKRYYYEHMHHRMPDSYGHAKDFFNVALADSTINPARGLLQFTNPSRSKPRPDDLLIFSPTLFNRYGHVAIVSRVSGAEVEIVQQNPGPFGKSRERIVLLYEKGTWKIGNGRIAGWLRLQADTLRRDSSSGQAAAGFPATGKTPADFCPAAYEIQYQADGDLNRDGLPDLVMVLRHKTDSTALRPVLVLLRQPDRLYRLDKISRNVFPIEYTEDRFKIYDTEDLSIDSGMLNIQLYAIGPNGNLFSRFRYQDNDLVLVDIETYNMGAGSHQQLNYAVQTGELQQEIINTMEEEMPSETRTFRLQPRNIKFEQADPEALIRSAYQQTDTE